MTQDSLPENWRDLVAGYVLGDLAPEEITQVQRWQQLHPEVAAELQSCQQTWATLPYALPVKTPPPRLKRRLVQATARSSVSSSPGPSRGSGGRWPLYGLGLGWAATAIALGVVSWENQQLRQDNQRIEAIVARFTQPQNRIYTLAGTEAQPNATGRLVVDPNTQRITVTTQALPPLPADQVYRLWAVAGAKPLFCGQFSPQAQMDIQEWTAPDRTCAEDSVQMLVTQEAIAAPPTPQGPLVLEGLPPS